MQEYTLQRTGLRPLTFEGELLAEASGERLGGRDHTRWHDLAVYRTAEGSFVVAVRLLTRWEGEHDHFAASITQDPTAVEAFLTAVDVCPSGIGYPPGPAYEERQAQKAADLRRRYEVLVTDLFGELGVEFEERIA